MSNTIVSHASQQSVQAVQPLQPQSPIVAQSHQAETAQKQPMAPPNQLNSQDQLNVIMPGKPGFDVGSFFSPTDAIIDSAVHRASAKYPQARQDAMEGFHADIASMTQNELDEMKDTLVQRMASPKTSQWERDILKQLYEVTDAVAEHRDPGLKPNKLFPFPGSPIQTPLPNDIIPFGKPELHHHHAQSMFKED